MSQFAVLLIATFEIFDNLSGFLSRLVEHYQFSFFFVCHFEIGYTFLKIIHNRIYEITNLNLFVCGYKVGCNLLNMKWKKSNLIVLYAILRQVINFWK